MLANVRRVSHLAVYGSGAIADIVVAWRIDIVEKRLNLVISPMWPEKRPLLCIVRMDGPQITR